MSTKTLIFSLALSSALGAFTIQNAEAASSYTCAAATTNTGLDFASSSVKCAAGYFYTTATGATGATCTKCTGTTAGATVAGASTWTCKTTAAGAVKIAAATDCKSGFKYVGGAADTNDDKCFACTSTGTTAATSITNAGTGATYTCATTDGTANTGIDFAATSVKCAAGYFYEVAATTNAAKCTKCTGTTAAATVAGADTWTCKTLSGGVKIAATGCKSAFKLVGGTGDTVDDKCAACTSTGTTAATSITNAGTGATYTCLTTDGTLLTGIDFASDVKCAKGYFYAAAATTNAATCVACTGAAAPTATVAGASTHSCKATGGSVVQIAACQSTFKLSPGADNTAADTCAQCTGGYVAPTAAPQSSASAVSASVALLLSVAALAL